MCWRGGGGNPSYHMILQTGTPGPSPAWIANSVLSPLPKGPSLVFSQPSLRHSGLVQRGNEALLSVWTPQEFQSGRGLTGTQVKSEIHRVFIRCRGPIYRTPAPRKCSRMPAQRPLNSLGWGLGLGWCSLMQCAQDMCQLWHTGAILSLNICSITSSYSFFPSHALSFLLASVLVMFRYFLQ